MQTLILFFCLSISAFAAWKIGRHLEHTRLATRIRDLEAKLRRSAGESLNLKEELNGMRTEVVTLQKSLNEARLSASSTVAVLTGSFRRSLVVMSTAALCSGLGMGGGFAWLYAGERAEKRYLAVQMETELDARLAKLQASVSEKQAESWQKQYEAATIENQEERVKTAVAETKLRILLNSLSFRPGINGFVVDDKKLRKNLRARVNETMPADRTLLNPPSGRP